MLDWIAPQRCATVRRLPETSAFEMVVPRLPTPDMRGVLLVLWQFRNKHVPAERNRWPVTTPSLLNPRRLIPRDMAFGAAAA